MNANNLTGALAKQAREQIGLSLISVAKITGINRNQLTQFEQEKTVLSAGEKHALIKVYAERGYHFEGLAEDGYDEFKTVKDSSLAQVKNEFGNELANILELLLQEHEDIVVSLQTQLERSTTDTAQKKQPDITLPAGYIDLDTKLVEHFTAMKNGKALPESGFFGYNTDQSAKLMALMALQYIRQLNARFPNIVTLSQAKCKEGTDNYHVLESISERLDMRYPKGFEHVTSDAVK